MDEILYSMRLISGAESLTSCTRDYLDSLEDACTAPSVNLLRWPFRGFHITRQFLPILLTASSSPPASRVPGSTACSATRRKGAEVPKTSPVEFPLAAAAIGDKHSARLSVYAEKLDADAKRRYTVKVALCGGVDPLILTSKEALFDIALVLKVELSDMKEYLVHATSL
ncbi:hypothetical protein HPB52_023795 [Rhipicephalus sanguineus]|uniref:Uncharacterized protein n=1 Tax=Rhipicephalus sanguineus TaxID=34632 RepID=A0A9D4Q4J0_RHISA|nr:hypothetical protein HPB52_023795 [Rhipicephalus sanguineus]